MPIFTNLGNLYSFIGRFVEAQESWSKALTIRPNFSMALANKGKGLFHYSQNIFDKYHHSIFKVYCYLYFKLALTYKKDIYPSALQDLEAFYLKMDNIIPDALAGFPCFILCLFNQK
jgi:tetratricopeptide (TPR) repeat protein